MNGRRGRILFVALAAAAAVVFLVASVAVLLRVSPGLRARALGALLSAPVPAEVREEAAEALAETPGDGALEDLVRYLNRADVAAERAAMTRALLGLFEATGERFGTRFERTGTGVSYYEPEAEEWPQILGFVNGWWARRTGRGAEAWMRVPPDDRAAVVIEYAPAEALARTHPLETLVAAWRILPAAESKTGLHGEVAKAIGRFGPAAAGAVPDLAPFATHEDLYLRQGAMEGLAGIGAAGLPALLDALRFRGRADDVTVRWDAAMALAKMEPAAAAAAVPALLERLLDPEENPNVTGECAGVLARIGPPAAEALLAARRSLYERSQREGLSPAEAGVLRTVNVALRGMNVEIPAE